MDHMCLLTSPLRLCLLIKNKICTHPQTLSSLKIERIMKVGFKTQNNCINMSMKERVVQKYEKWKRDLKHNIGMRDRVVQKLSQNNCINIIFLFPLLVYCYKLCIHGAFDLLIRLKMRRVKLKSFVFDSIR